MNSYLQFAGNGSSAIEQLVVVLDASYSMDSDDWPPTRLDGAKEAACALIDVKAQHHPRDLVGVVSFGITDKIEHRLGCVSTDGPSLTRSIDRLKTRNATNITAGLLGAGTLFSREPIGRVATGLLRKVSLFMNDRVDIAEPRATSNEPTSNRIILLTDGEHNTGPDPETIADRLKNHDVHIDVIGIGGSPDDVDERCLKKLASKRSDGTPSYCFIGDKAALVREFKKLAKHIRRA